MKCSIIPLISCLFLCFNSMIFANELTLFKSLLSSPLIPSDVRTGLSFISLGMDQYQKAASTNDLLKELKAIQSTAARIETIVKGQSETIVKQWQRLDGIDKDERQIIELSGKLLSEYDGMRFNKNKSKGRPKAGDENHIKENAIRIYRDLNQLMDLVSPGSLGGTSIIQKIYDDISLKVKQFEYHYY